MEKTETEYSRQGDAHKAGVGGSTGQEEYTVEFSAAAYAVWPFCEQSILRMQKSSILIPAR
jgi:hypothetical protein